MKSWIQALLLVVPVGLIAASLLVAVNNPTISHTREGTYTCLAPYDDVLLGSSNGRGDKPDLADIVARCDHADRTRFTIAAVVFGVGVLDGLVATALVLRSRRRAESPFVTPGL